MNIKLSGNKAGNSQGNKSKKKLPPINSTNQVKKTKNSTNNKIHENNANLDTENSKSIEKDNNINLEIPNNNDNINTENNDKEQKTSKKDMESLTKVKRKAQLVTIEEKEKDQNINGRNSSLLFNKNKINENTTNVSNVVNKNNASVIIDETGIDKKKKPIVPKVYKIIIVFRNEDFYITAKPDTSIKNLRLSISKLINLETKQIGMIYNDKEINTSNDDKTISTYFNFKKMRSRPIIYIRKKCIFNNIDDPSSGYYLFKKNFNNRVKVTNFPPINDIKCTIDDNINNVIINFFKNYSSYGEEISENNQYKIELGNDKIDGKNDFTSYIIGFPSPDLAFDFNRYISSLKLINPVFKDVKSNIISMKKRSCDHKQNNLNNNNKMILKGNLRYGIDYNLEETDLTKRNTEILKLIRNNFLQRNNLKKEKNKSQIFINATGPYLSSFDKDRIEEKENRKKWICPEGFISCVGKYSGIQL